MGQRTISGEASDSALWEAARRVYERSGRWSCLPWTPRLKAREGGPQEMEEHGRATWSLTTAWPLAWTAASLDSPAGSSED